LTGDDWDDKQVVQETKLVNQIGKSNGGDFEGLMMTLRPKEQRRHRQADLQGYLGILGKIFYDVYNVYACARAVFYIVF
jgi:hypothetical protein